MTRRRRRRRTAATLARGLAVLGLIVTLAVLWSLGDPPVVGIDRLWVRERREAVILMLVAAGVAVAATGLAAAFASRDRWILVLAWLAAVAVSATFFPDRIVTVVQVVLGRLGVG